MKLKNAFPAGIVMAAALLLAGSATVVSAQGGKTTLCHYSVDEDCWVTISVSDNAVDAHLAHGDSLDVDNCATTCSVPE